MTSKSVTKDREKAYKLLTKQKFLDLLSDMDLMQAALAHLSYIHQAAGNGQMNIPLEHHPMTTFEFKVIQNKVTGLQMLCVALVSNDSSITH